MKSEMKTEHLSMFLKRVKSLLDSKTITLAESGRLYKAARNVSPSMSDEQFSAWVTKMPQIPAETARIPASKADARKMLEDFSGSMFERQLLALQAQGVRSFKMFF